MNKVLTLSAAMLIAMSMSACGSNDESDSAAADNPSADAQTNTASANSQNSATEMAAGEGAAAGGQASTGADQTGQASDEDTPKAAIAVLHGTQGNDDVMATVRFTPSDGGLSYTATASGLAPGEHGYHIHLYGDCSAADGTSAGTHFNLQGSSENPPADIDHITGDLGNLDAGDDGSAQDEGMLDGASLTGPKSIIGRGVIIHAKPNDPSQPPIGAAGSRQACGVIGIANPKSAQAGAGAQSNMSNGASQGSGSESPSDSASGGQM
ncbi:superoxide dismutase family protein [Salinisphaera sp. T31B1]|uniref:superoxide dismutase family protein n=1 Tax=Salinisphaera sp. T31B1 TaxID=727963 RepID=UPI003342822F